ncbi:hypothetical protein Hamer_G000657 [Homarus americanus]|uniref:Uncharacterized protein n=1 Tax=Homarus americanus TaxID=6706 RepID=A0A8J5TL18_HOMAM|nr:hypothetical protein Hamer_G000657 [Homarus americanus]
MRTIELHHKLRKDGVCRSIISNVGLEQDISWSGRVSSGSDCHADHVDFAFAIKRRCSIATNSSQKKHFVAEESLPSVDVTWDSCVTQTLPELICRVLVGLPPSVC